MVLRGPAAVCPPHFAGDFYVPVCNALRILTRVMPILYETDPQFPLYAEHLLWQNKVFGKDGQEVGVQTKNWCVL